VACRAGGHGSQKSGKATQWRINGAGEFVGLVGRGYLPRACERWPGTPITLRQGARVIEDSRRLRVV